MATEEITVTVERSVHDALSELAQAVWDKHGVCVQSVRFSWVDLSTTAESRMIVTAVEVETLMNEPKDQNEAAAEPPLDCRVGQRIERYLRQLAPHQNEREGPQLMREALAEIERLREALRKHDAWLGQAHVLCSDMGVPHGHIEDRLFEAIGKVHNA